MQRKGRPRTKDGTGQMRDCFRHGWIEFHQYGGRWRCRRCVGEAVTRRHRRLRALLLAEAGGSCAVCGYRRCDHALQFHHVNPADKAFNMSMATGRSLAAYREEAKKCVLVCANCHVEIEAGVTPSPPPGATYTRSVPAPMV